MPKQKNNGEEEGTNETLYRIHRMHAGSSSFHIDIIDYP